MKKTVLAFVALMVVSGLAFSVQQKELDYDVSYDESMIHPYELPDPLLTTEGKPITTAEEWMTIRRPQIMSLFSTMIYGSIPKPASPITIEFDVLDIDKDFMGSKGIRKEVLIRLSNEQGSVETTIFVFVPNNVTKPVPVFMMNNFDSGGGLTLDPNDPIKTRSGIPLGIMFDRGYGFVSVYHGDMVRHNEVDFNRGIFPLFYKKGQSFPMAYEWGVLTASSYVTMRAMDYLETDDDVDHTKVALMGHSKMGKVTVWTAAQDQRFAMAISAQSGCAGAALWRRKSGETIQKMVTRFPYWLCRNAWKFVNNEEDMPVDQHMLLACIAPRPVYVHSSTGDTWADSRGEYLSAYHATPVYELLGKTGLTSEKMPEENAPINTRTVGFHTRPGGHSIESYDWMRFIDFADNQLK